MNWICLCFFQLRRLRHCVQGTSAIEFAIVAPVFLLLLFGIIEFAMIMLVSNVMESATTISSRLGRTGSADAGISREDTIRNSIVASAGSLINPANLTITAKSYEQIDSIGDAEPYTDSSGNGLYDVGEPYTDVNGNAVWDSDMGAAGYGNSGDIVVYSISYPWPLLTPVITNMIGSNGVFTITARAVVKNEPF